jgi:excinuclease UvrABC nuclease subunit
MFRKLYGYRTCEKKLDGSKVERPCLYHQVGECPGPCSGKVSEDEYKKGINEIIRFFEGDTAGVVKDLKSKMLKCSENMEFEQAAAYRDMLNNIQEMTQVQRVTASDDMNRDVIGIAMKDFKAIVQVFFIRSGKMDKSNELFFRLARNWSASIPITVSIFLRVSIITGLSEFTSSLNKLYHSLIRAIRLHQLDFKVPAILLPQRAEDNARNKHEQGYHHHYTADNQRGEPRDQPGPKVIHPHRNKEYYCKNWYHY